MPHGSSPGLAGRILVAPCREYPSTFHKTSAPRIHGAGPRGAVRCDAATKLYTRLGRGAGVARGSTDLRLRLPRVGAMTRGRWAFARREHSQPGLRWDFTAARCARTGLADAAPYRDTRAGYSWQ